MKIVDVTKRMVKVPVIGKGTTIHPTAHVFSWVVIGKNCHIRAGAVIGALGLSLTGSRKKKFLRKPATGRVIIKDDCDIGANTVIQRGQTRDTVIGENTFIAPNCSIGHDTIIGKRVIITGANHINGYCEIGDGVYIAPNSCILNRRKIGRDALIGIGSLVLHNVPPNTVVYGRPAKPRKRQPRRFLNKALLHKA